MTAHRPSDEDMVRLMEAGLHGFVDRAESLEVYPVGSDIALLEDYRIGIVTGVNEAGEHFDPTVSLEIDVRRRHEGATDTVEETLRMVIPPTMVADLIIHLVEAVTTLPEMKR